MTIRRVDNFWVDHDLQGRLLIGMQSARLAECVTEARRRRAYGIFGNPYFGFREKSLDFLTQMPDIASIWLWDIKLANIDGIYALKKLKSFGVHTDRPPIDFARLRTLEEVVWFYREQDRGIAKLKKLRALNIWHFKPRQRSFEGLELPRSLEELEITWANPKNLAGLENLPRIKRFVARRCRNLESIGELPRIAPNVEHLVVATCGRVADGPAVVRRLPKLRHAFVRDAVLVSR